MLGKSLKKLNATREQYVILTKCYQPLMAGQVGGGRPPMSGLDEAGYVNQHGLSRKVNSGNVLEIPQWLRCARPAAHLRCSPQLAQAPRHAIY